MPGWEALRSKNKDARANWTGQNTDDQLGVGGGDLTAHVNCGPKLVVS